MKETIVVGQDRESRANEGRRQKLEFRAETGRYTSTTCIEITEPDQKLRGESWDSHCRGCDLDGAPMMTLDAGV